MKKRLFSLLIATSMLVGINPILNVSAATNLFNNGSWRDASNNLTTSKVEVCTDATNVFSGTNSLHIVAENKEVPYAQSAVITNSGGSKYLTLEFYAKGTDVGGLRTNFFGSNFNLANSNTYKVGTEVDGWQKYSVLAKGPANDTRIPFFPITNSTLDCYIDNVRVIDDETGTDYAAAMSGVGGIGEQLTNTPLANSTIVADTSGEEYNTAIWSLRANDGELGDGSAYDLRYSTAKAHTGQRSFRLQYDEEGDVRGVKYMELRSVNTTTADGTITVEFYANGVTDASTVITLVPGVGEVALSQYTADTTDATWTKYTYTGTASTTANEYRVNNFRIRLTADSDIYIDDITVTDSSNADILADTGTFEPGYTPTITPDTTGADCSADWTIRTGDGGLATSAYEAKYSTQQFFDGNRSLHIQYDENDLDNSKFMEIRTVKNTTQYGDFTISFYAYSENPDDIQNIGIIFPTYAEVALSDYTVTQTSKTGWNLYTYTGTITSGTNRPDTLRIHINAKSDVYIDEMTITQPDGTDMLADTGNFDLKAPTITEDITLKAIPQGVTDMGNGQSMVHTPNAGMNTRVSNGKATYAVGISNLETYDGNGSMHIQLALADAAAIGDSVAIKLQNVQYPAASMGGKFFKVSFYAKGDTSGLGLQFFDSYATCWLSNWAGKGGTVTNIDGSDWKLYQIIIPRTSAGSNDRCTIAFYNNADVYIDNFTVTEVTDATGETPVENSTYNMSYNFETEASALTDKAFTPVMYDKNGNVITALTTAQSNKKITAKSAVANWSNSEYSDTAQLIICVYDGYRLADIRRSEIKTVTMGNSAVTLSCDINMPSYSDVGDLRVRAYLWNSVGGMKPLADYNELTAE